MRLQILGTGCAKCHKLADNTREAAAELGIDAAVEKVEEIQQIISFGVMSTPALVVDGQVRVSGRVPSVEQIKVILAPTP